MSCLSQKSLTHQRVLRRRASVSLQFLMVESTPIAKKICRKRVTSIPAILAEQMLTLLDPRVKKMEDLLSLKARMPRGSAVNTRAIRRALLVLTLARKAIPVSVRRIRILTIPTPVVIRSTAAMSGDPKAKVIENPTPRQRNISHKHVLRLLRLLRELPERRRS